MQKSAGLQIIRKYDMQPGFFAEIDRKRQKLSLPLADFSYRKNQQKLSAASRLPLGGKVPSKSEANEGRD